MINVPKSKLITISDLTEVDCYYYIGEYVDTNNVIWVDKNQAQLSIDYYNEMIGEKLQK